MKRFMTSWTAGTLVLASVVACSESLGPDGSRRALGILQLLGDEGPGLVSITSTTDPIVWSHAPGEGVIYPPSVIEAPDTVEVGQTFQVTVNTVGPSGCWFADGLDVVQSQRVIELTAWDRHSGADFCTLALVYLPHTASLTLDEPGEWILEATGRRTGGEREPGESVTAERRIFVRPPYTTEEPFEAVFAIGDEIRVDGIFRVLLSDVTEDSRCPVDVVCVWEGNAAVVVGLTLGTGPTHPFTLNTALDPRSAEHGGYRVTLVGIEPAPRSDAPIAREAYRATLRIESIS